MARQTRSERRARRAAQQESQTAVQRTRTRPQQQQQQQQLRPAAAEPATADAGRRVPGSGFRNFVLESWGELKKVDWPGQQQLVQGTAVVLIACLITGVYLFLADQIFRRFVQHVLLGG
ncbi:MAG: preprotein translocase subunit SecE [Actinomycetota bacterium]|nr:preprotein translocase subunit SecE [Actinomycetota bacterium]